MDYKERKYKEEKQKDLYAKFECKSKDLPNFIKEYFVFLKSNTTKINNLGTITKFLNWLCESKIICNDIEKLNPKDLTNITPIHMVNYLNYLRNVEGMKNSSVITKMNIISGLWSYLIDYDFVNKNIVNDRIRDNFKQKKNHKIDVPTDKEIDELILNIENIKDERVAIKYLAIIKLFIGSGIRMDELVGLDVDDLYFDCENPVIAIIRKGKQDKDEEEEVPVSQEAVEAVNDWLKVKNARETTRDMKPLFISNRGKRLTVSAITNELKRCSNGRIHAHLFRHLTATKMLKSGCNIVNVSKQLGHADPKTTLKFYAEVDNGENYKALNSF